MTRLTEDDYDVCVKAAVREGYPEWPQTLDVANAIYQLGIERGKIEREKYSSFICNKCVLRQDSKPWVRVVSESRDRSDAYDKIDSHLRNNLDDTDYAEYSAALELVFHATPDTAGG